MKPYSNPHRHCRLPRLAAGMSLVELMIAMTISLVLLGAVAGIFVSTSTARNEVERTSRQIENGRYAAEILSDDLRLAGFYGELDVANKAPPLPGVAPDPCSLNAADWEASIKMHVQGFSNVAGAPGTCAMTNLKPGTDIVVVRRVQACQAGVAGCEAVSAARPYLQVSRCNSLPIEADYLMTLGAVAPTLRLLDCATAGPRRRYLVNVYFISTDNGAGVSVPTLKRLELEGNSWTVTPLVEGIEQLKFTYGIDNNGDGTPDAYDSAPATVADWGNVVTAKFFILARNIEESPGYTDTKTYTLGTTAVAAANDGYRRHVYSGLVRISNPAGARDVP